MAPSSPSIPTVWDVFLSFRGIDTRKSFTSHLYNKLCPTGIRTFMDDPELRGGDVISSELRNVIMQSKVYVVVLSENYASSGWCLDELVNIMECQESMERLVLPMFYNIDPSVVRRQTGTFNQAFKKHESRLDKELVNKWRVTLQQVANLSGYDLSDGKTEAAVINKIVERLLLEINPGTLEVAEYPVGIDASVANIKSLLSSSHSIINGVHWVGIHGMGGVGKTTLAKALYNQMFRTFDGSCFLANVKNVCKIPKGLESLQEQLIDDILKRKNTVKITNADGGINSIRERVCSLKVLVVLDDLDDREQVHYLVGNFLAGSLIILTTRNEDLLDKLNVEARYPVDKLGDPESRELFTRHAFGDSRIPGEFMDMSTKIIRRAGGLPLALRVFGSNLINLDIEGWRSFFYRLQEIPMDDVESKLMVSFNALNDPILESVFLDIACFFVGQKKDVVVPILGTCYEFINHYISVLKKRCLITINEKDELSMHDLLVDMGRKIARNGSPKNMPGKHSRLFDDKDVLDVLQNNKGTEAIEGIFLKGPKWSLGTDSFDAGTFKRMPNLRLLALARSTVTGSLSGAWKNLKMLDWWRCPGLPSDFCPENLVILRLTRCLSDIIWQRTMVLRNLKILDMSFSGKLSTTPDFSGLQCLETLNFAECSKLEEVHSSVGSLVRLVNLDLHKCENLRSLPDTIGNLRSLESLDISECSRLNSLPTQLGNISKLVRLKLSHCNKLKTLPNTICKLRSLEIIDFSSCKKIVELAGGDSQLSNLQFPSTLKEFKASGCSSLLRLPSLSNLKHLEILELGGCSGLTLIRGLEELTSIREFRLFYCPKTRGLPSLSNLKHLEILELSGCSSLAEVQGLEDLTSIKQLRLEDCESLKGFVNLSKLKHLEILILNYCSSLTKIQGLEDLTSIKQIDLGFCRSLKGLPNLSKLKYLEILYLNGCSSLTKIQGLEDLTSVKEIEMGDCRSLKELPNLSKLKHLEILYLSGCSSLTKIQGLEDLNYKKIELKDCDLLTHIT